MSYNAVVLSRKRRRRRTAARASQACMDGMNPENGATCHDKETGGRLTWRKE